MIYDPDTLDELAKSLDDHANQIISSYRLRGLFYGFILFVVIGGFVAGPLAAVTSNPIGLAGWVAVAIIGAIYSASFGAKIGFKKALMIRAQTHTILCFKQIEENTRQ